MNFEVLSPAGTPLSYHTFETEAAAAGLHVRTGSHCNPGAAYAHLGEWAEGGFDMLHATCTYTQTHTLARTHTHNNQSSAHADRTEAPTMPRHTCHTPLPP